MSPFWDEVRPASRQSIDLPVCQEADGRWLNLAVLIVRGCSPGPTLLLLGSVHGDEYEGPAAIWDTYRQADPAALRGTLVLLPVANPPAYQAGQRVNPADPKDLARTFPGSSNGTVTERIAAVIQESLVAHADLLCDLHSAGRLYRIDPWAGYALVSDSKRLDQQRRVARILGYPTVWGSPLLPGRSLWAADRCGVPAIYVEAPGEGRCRPEDVERNRRAIAQILRFLGMVDEPPLNLAPQRFIEDAQPGGGYLQVQIVSRSGGYFHAQVEVGAGVEQGQVLGEIWDPAGRILERIEAPHAGRLMFLRTFPVVAPGDALAYVLPLAGAGKSGSIP